MNWQTPAALAVVALTALIFLVRLRRSRKSCGGGCCQKTGPMELTRPRDPK